MGILSDFLEQIRPGTDCIPWPGAPDRDGYGQLKVQGRTYAAHRASYERHVGPIPDGLVIDHLCRNRACVNPRHLEPVTNFENIKRGRGYGWRSGVHDRCKRGHDLTNANLYTAPSGARVCKECRKAAKLRYRARLRAAGKARR